MKTTPLRSEKAPAPIPTVVGGFSTILADPPWRFANRTGKVAPEHRRLDRYSTMTLEAIKALKEEVGLPMTSGAFSDLRDTRWVKQRAADVDRWSNGRLGYVHIRSMGDESFRDIYSDILGRYNDRDGIVIDTRFNGGGRLHEDIEVLFSGRKYVTQVIRGREACDMPSRRWNKPSIMLQCEANYSNAHGTPWVYKHQ